ncbi:intersectin-1 isoform X3 [Leptopilina heterotoma]|uniref:intersectin-1 isoform X3 n=1 Tax=Leptopilina heterotoma TaxID=63436 RepID=UPI001CAA1D9E|nr:intersectin-1 isoform X3 [Leptopilina heterotoma]
MATSTTPGSDPWVIQARERVRYQEQFDSLKPNNGVVTGDQVKGFLLQSQLPPQVLGQIWGLSDTDSDGKMDINEFSIACKLINLKLRGFAIPSTLPPILVQSLKAFSSVGTPPVVGAIPQPIAPPPANVAVRPPLPAPPIGPSFVPSTGPPPKPPAPPSFPNSPAISPANKIQPPVVPAVHPISSTTSMDLLDLDLFEVSMPAVAPIAPLNTNPTPIAAFGMGPTVPMQPMVPGMVPGMMQPIGTVPGVVPTMTAMPTGNGSIPTAGVMPMVSSVTPPSVSMPPGSIPVNGSAIHTPVSSNTPLSTTARPPSIDRVGSMDSQHSQHSIPSIGSPQSIDWAVPHQTKLKYTQLFNTWDRTRSGFLSGPQARNIMVQSQLPQQILAQIWTLSDMDSDGRLGCEEFVLAMHLCDMAKCGENIPVALPLDLIPPTFRRQRQSSLTPSQGTPDIDPSLGMPQSSFEDKRKENFEKGQAELERRRKALLEIQRKEQEERERKEREEAEKQEKIRLEQERRRQAEIEKQMLRQKEIEQEKEEQRKRAQEQREAARKEMERQRQLEWETQKSQELQTQRQKEQDILLKLKAKNQTLSIELGSLNDRVKELSQKICDTRVGVSGVKTTIDGMRSTRDSQLKEMAALKNKLREQNQRLLNISQEKARIDAKNKMNAAQDAAGQEAIKMAFANKQITLKQMRDKIEDLQQQVNAKKTDIENNNSQLEEVKTQMQNLVTDCKCLYTNFNDKKSQVLQLKTSSGGNYSSSAWGDSAWGDSGQNFESVDETSWPATDSAPVESTTETTGGVKYRALYEFKARNQDEISFQPGDIILVTSVPNAEEGWLAGEIRGHTGWFPGSYVEPLDAAEVNTGSAFIQQDSMEKRTLEEIAEVPENVSDAGSLVGEGPTVDPIVPTLGLGTVCNIRVTAIYSYRPTTQQHLTFDKDEILTVSEQQGDWWYGEGNNGNSGWFPKSYVSTAVTNGQEVPSTDGGLNEYYMALYEYTSKESGDLNFIQGEVVLVVKKDGDWWTGVIGNRTGIFPSNYVDKCDMPITGNAIPTNGEATAESAAVPISAAETDVIMRQDSVTAATTTSAVQQSPLQEKTAEQLEEEIAEAEDQAELPDFAAMSAQQKSRKPEIVQVIAPYQATSAEQLNLQRGQLIMIRKKTDTGWWEGELQARGKKRQIGWFPASYVKLLTSNSNRSTPVSHGYLDSPTDPNIERVMALYPYQAQNEDELSFEKGDVITVLAKEEEAWWRGELNGVSGVFPSNYVSSMSSEMINEVMMTQLEPTERKRQEYIKELIATEQAYIEDMRLVHEVFEKPLLESLVLSVDEVDRIFVNWRDIIACNDNFLRTLRIRRDNSDGGIVRMIGDILCENIPRMSAYVRFCSCQISAAVYLQKLTENSPDFVEVAQRCQQDSRTKGMPLSSFLIKPMQRITKYPLIIGKILENTPSHHPDRQYLTEALSKADEFCIQVNEGVREKENSDRLEWLQTHVACDGLEEQLVFNSLTNSLGPRKLIHFGILHKAKSGKELVAFLTNDFLLFAQPTKSLPSGQQFSFERNSHHKFKMYRKPIFLNELFLAGESETSSSGNGNDSTEHSSRTLRLRDAKKLIILQAPSTSECTLWTRRIAEAKKQFAENERTRLQRQRSKQAQFGACGRILVTVLEGSSLKTISGKCNAFCKVAMGSQEEQTVVVSGTDCPLWDASMQFQVKDLHEDTLCITVFDKGYYSPDEFMGRAEVRVVDIMRDSNDSCGPIQKRIKLREVERGDVVLKLDLRLFNESTNFINKNGNSRIIDTRA